MSLTTRQRLIFALAVAVCAVLFFIANRGAYEGFFSDDDIDNIAWTRVTEPGVYAWGLLAPKYYAQHFRPVGHATFRLIGELAGLNFKPYVALVHLLHLANTILVFLLLRRFTLAVWPATAGALLFLFPMQVFDALWKPMYLFDVWCAFFSLACLLSWTTRRYVLAFICFWFAFKSKEHAVMLPFVLAAYEYYLGERRWKPLLPFFGLSALFAFQGFFFNKEQGNDYRIHLSPWMLVKTSSFYLSRVLLYPWLGLALLALPRLTRDRRVYFALTAATLLLLPMLVLPNRLFAAYLYVSVAFVMMALAFAFTRLHWAIVAAILAVWLPINYANLKSQRKAALTYAQENRAYVSQILDLKNTHPDVRRFVVDGNPQEFRWWGIQGALRWTYRTFDVELISVEDKNLSEVFSTGGVALLSWEPPTRRLVVTSRQPNQQDASYLKMGRYMPLWQLENGWYQAEGRYRWTAPTASARLYRPADAKQFQIEVNVGPQYIDMVKAAHIRILIGGEQIGETTFTHHGWQAVQFPLKPAPAGTVHVTFEIDPPLRPNPNEPRVLGVPMGTFGFLP